jgi:hypothetical protein
MSREAPSGKDRKQFTIVMNSDNSEPARSPASSKAGSMPSLLMRLISERYQTFNRQMEEPRPSGA